APLVVQLQTGAGLHPFAPRAAAHLLAVLRHVAAPQRVLGRLGARLGPAEAHEAAGHVTRGIGGALLDLFHVSRRVRSPAGIGGELGRAVLLVLEVPRRRERLILLPTVLQHEAVWRRPPRPW